MVEPSDLARHIDTMDCTRQTVVLKLKLWCLVLMREEVRATVLEVRERGRETERPRERCKLLVGWWKECMRQETGPTAIFLYFSGRSQTVGNYIPRLLPDIEMLL